MHKHDDINWNPTETQKQIKVLDLIKDVYWVGFINKKNGRWQMDWNNFDKEVMVSFLWTFFHVILMQDSKFKSMLHKMIDEVHDNMYGDGIDEKKVN